MDVNNTFITLENELYSKNKGKVKSEETKGKSSEERYKDILEKVTSIITEAHSSELASVLYDKSAEPRLRNLINKYLISEKLIDTTLDNLQDLTSRIYEDMAGISFVKGYLDDPEVEEININGPNATWVVYPDRKVLVDDKFLNPHSTINIIKKMSRMGGLILDGTSPVGDSFLRTGVRMSAAIDPVVDDKTVGGIASIRKQKPAVITEDNLIDYGTASKDELDFLTLCINNKISIAIAGATGSGKTADLNFLLRTIPDTKRIYTIEDTRELQIEKYNEEGKKVNDVVQLYTKEPPNAVTMDDLVRTALRFHPEIIVPAEMRGKEAQPVVEAGRTGHTILSSLHANSAQDAYDRILSMYLMAGTPLSEERILKMIVSAFPIILYKAQLVDKSRKYIEIFEATGVVDGDVVGNTIFKFEPTNIVKDDKDNIVKIEGEHKQVHSISRKLADTLRLSGIEKDVISKFYYKEEM